MSQTPLLDVFDVTAPCPVAWESMRGDANVRFCDRCRHHVYDFSALTRDEAEALLRESAGRLCVRLFRRADGRILTRDCGRPLHSHARRLATLVAGAAAVLLAAVFASPEARRETYRAVMKWLTPTARTKTFVSAPTLGIGSPPR